MKTQSPFDLSALQQTLKGKGPLPILKAALAHYENIAISFSGAEDVALIDMASRLRAGIRIFTLDTGRLHPETYQFIEKVRETFDIRLEILSPEAAPLQQMVNEKGLYSFLRDGHQECCAIRKVEPLRRQLQGLDAWLTGQRRDQNPTRAELAEVEIDVTFSGPGKTLVKFNPLANWSSSQVWDYIEAYQVPYNGLHERGFISIGCEPCTRPVRPNQHEREGRWWWEDGAKKECGLHAANLES
ncbi:phosphoadenylyl-sulfate reductase [Candidatus Methylospira mobilis]|uniref:Adenosine 5'-phosphosulfate reductase n=1 Tax=Candidatus Methylospira mobilis TaxID=1808979 RepID=A0A5Q0BJG0_9GAMM|nr:phosphoadenylyl-sulfate reductase [Candidatus Methylospira mobilis]QFY41946.1 phosphoadenylyl-sulfate reductase [Candidatus Methylospira mobilis]WNV02937.1 phosphoadenylyl-sulfate reductase [Candidatus Methylospira mobilis]